MELIDKSPQNGLVRMEILEAIQERGKRDLSVYGLSWVRGADMFILKALKQLKRSNLVSVRINYAAHWVSAPGGGIVGDFTLKNYCALNPEFSLSTKEGYNGRSH